MNIENFDKVRALVAARLAAVVVLETLDGAFDKAGYIETEYWPAAQARAEKFLILKSEWVKTFRPRHVANIHAIEEDLRALGVSFDPLPPASITTAEAAE